MPHFVVLGSHPMLSLAEIEAVLGEDARITPCGNAAVIDGPAWDGREAMRVLGGTVKLGDIVAELPYDDVRPETMADLLLEHPREARIVFGLTVYGENAAQHKRLTNMGLAVKRVLQRKGKSVRWVTSRDSGAPVPAAVEKLDLTKDGYDLALIVSGGRIFIGLTTHVQDATAWSRRDYGRPARSEEAGMLPPKLARMMVNLARVPSGGTLLDPFCGSGTILMEAALATDAKDIIGSDLEPTQVAASTKNLDWLLAEGIVPSGDRKRFRLFRSDARHIAKRLKPDSVDAVVTEGSLGPLLKGSEPQSSLDNTVKELSMLWRETLPVLRSVLRAQGRLVCIWPKFVTSRGRAEMRLSDQALAAAGFRRSGEPLSYARPGQRVIRNIIRLERA